MFKKSRNLQLTALVIMVLLLAGLASTCWFAADAGERWDGKLPTTVVPNGTLPFIDVKVGK